MNCAKCHPPVLSNAVCCENTAAVSLFAGYVIPLTVLAALVKFTRTTVIGVSLSVGGTIRSPFSASLTNVTQVNTRFERFRLRLNI